MPRQVLYRTNKYEIGPRGSSAVEVIEQAWEQLRSLIPPLPPAVITLVDARSRRRLHGYFLRSVWRKRRGSAHEIAINPRLLAHPPDLLATLLHEAAHAVLHEAGKDGGMGSTPYYHTKIFRNQARAFGLECGFHNSR